MRRIIIVQHCQSEHHINELTGGWTDTPLTTLGVQQAQNVTTELQRLNVQDFVLYSSDLLRASMTAKIIGQVFKKEVLECSELREINNGVAKNQTKLWAKEHQLYHEQTLRIDEPLWDKGETPRELYQRMTGFIETHVMGTDKDVVLVGHGVAISYLISSWIGVPVEKMSHSFLKGNAGGISSLTINPMGQRVLMQFNSCSHLY